MAVEIIGEIGINANGSIDLAKQLIGMALEAGASCIKLQKRDVDLTYSPEELAQPRTSPFGQTNGDLKRGLEFSRADYDEIDRYCKALGMQWTASCWDVPSVEFIASYQPPFLKIPSARLTDLDLLDAYAATGLPLILSTGMSTIEEIDRAVVELDNTDLTLLACTATYPCPLEEINLLQIPTLRARYGLPIGFSSHCKSPWPCLGAVALGATVVEVHITMAHELFGSDQASSLEPIAFGKLCTEIRDMEKAMGDGVKQVYASEQPIKAKLRKVHA